jgi:hypothetical protein
MRDRDLDELARWLAAEQAGLDDEADWLFAAVFARSVPRLAPPDTLGARVLAAWAARRAVFDPFASRWAKAVVGATLGVVGISLAILSPRLVFNGLLVGAGLMVRLSGSVVASGRVVAGLALASWPVAASLAHAAAFVATTGPAGLVIGANLLLAVAAVAGLKRLLAPREECV